MENHSAYPRKRFEIDLTQQLRYSFSLFTTKERCHLIVDIFKVFDIIARFDDTVRVLPFLKYHHEGTWSRLQISNRSGVFMRVLDDIIEKMETNNDLWNRTTEKMSYDDLKRFEILNERKTVELLHGLIQATDEIDERFLIFITFLLALDSGNVHNQKKTKEEILKNINLTVLEAEEIEDTLNDMGLLVYFIPNRPED